ncbi:hypothetical protein AAKU61_001427 [Undibacterium sp. GrIS 1.2]|uniref:hypothetical protein n=1 Tax=Undibacterium sp. GrIS 1.2 TaxID=3143933 RepID=UPI003399FEA1
MHPLVIEYRALPASTDHLPDDGLNDRKRVLINTLDTEANDKDVSALLRKRPTLPSMNSK